MQSELIKECKLKWCGLFGYVSSFTMVLVKAGNYYYILDKEHRLKYDSFEEGLQAFDFYQWYYKQKFDSEIKKYKEETK